MTTDDPAGTSEVLRVDIEALRRVAAEFADLPGGSTDAAVLEGAGGLAGAAVSAGADGFGEGLRSAGVVPVGGVGPAASIAAAAEVVEATLAQLRDIAAATAAFADGLREAARRYSEADDRAADIMARYHR